MAIALVAVACSSGAGGDAPAGEDQVAAGGSLSEEDQALADGVAKSMVESSGSEVPISAEDAACFGTRIVSEMGSDRLTELGLDVASAETEASLYDLNLSDDDVDAMANAFVECIDLGEMLAGEFTDTDVSEDSIQCISGGFDDDLLKTVAVSIFSGQNIDGNDEASQGFSNVIRSCLTPEELQRLSS